ncbi:MAG: hypothetical protein EOL97_13450, partial [Spirochaetia bacterium]|nr:hypothetical protein [Spirochaetia bacterium]
MSIKFEGNERSRLYSAELNSIAYANRNAVLDGCEVTADSPASMDVTVSSGRVFFSSEIVDVTGTDVTISANATAFTRLDLVVVDNTGTLSVVTGTPGILPMTPDYDPETKVVLAMITVDAGTTSIISSKIKDIRSINSGGAGGGAGIGSVGKYRQEFTSQTSVTVNHYLADNNPIVQVYDSTGEIIIPDSIETVDENTITVTFLVSTSGFIVVHGGTSGSNAYFTKEMTSSDTWNVEHNLANKYVSVTCYDTSDEMIFPEGIEIVDEDNITITFGSATAGRVVVMGGVSELKLILDTTPELGGELDAGAHSIGFTMQTATGDGTTTINWKLGNKFKFTFGAQSETFTFTAPTKPCSLTLIL